VSNSEKLSVELTGTIKQISLVKFLFDGTETLLEVEINTEEIKEAENKIRSVEERYRYNPLDKPNPKSLRLRFRGNVHSDVIGKPFVYKLIVTDPSEIGIEGEYSIVKQSLIIGENERLYFSEFEKTFPYRKRSTGAIDVMTLLNMPDHLRKTAQTVVTLGRVTAYDVAEQTKRARAVESAYLNQLVVMGHLKKERKGRKAYFYVESQKIE